MNRFLSLFSRKSTILIFVLALIALAPFASAQSPTQLDKHARKIEKRLSRFRKGSYVEVAFRDSSQSFGSVGDLSYTSFQFTDADNNKTETHLYSEVADVKKAREYIGEGSEPHHHMHVLLPVIIGAGAAAAGIATYEALR